MIMREDKKAEEGDQAEVHGGLQNYWEAGAPDWDEVQDPEA